MTTNKGFQPMAVHDRVRAIINVAQITKISPAMGKNHCIIHLTDGSSLEHNENFNEMAKVLEEETYEKFYK